MVEGRQRKYNRLLHEEKNQNQQDGAISGFTAASHTLKQVILQTASALLTFDRPRYGKPCKFQSNIYTEVA